MAQLVQQPAPTQVQHPAPMMTHEYAYSKRCVNCVTALFLMYTSADGVIVVDSYDISSWLAGHSHGLCRWLLREQVLQPVRRSYYDCSLVICAQGLL